MTEESPSAGTEAPAAPLPAATDASGTRRYLRGLLFGLGALTGVAWLGAVLLDLWMPVAHLVSPGLRSGLRVVLVLAVPTLIVLVPRSPRLPVRRPARAVAFVVVEALLLVLVVLAALPALLPYSTPGDLFSLPLRLPTPSLGAALAAVDPLVRARRQGQARRDRGREQQGLERNVPDASMVLVASAGFGAVLVVTAVVVLGLIFHASPCSGGGRFNCGGALALVVMVLIGDTFISIFVGLFGAWLGFALGTQIARLDRSA